MIDENFFNLRNGIEKQLDENRRDFVIYPFGKIGFQVKTILNEVYGIKEKYIVDDHLCKYNPNIKDADLLPSIAREGCVLLFSTINDNLYGQLLKKCKQYFNEEMIVSISDGIIPMDSVHTDIGHHSYGTICRNHPLIREIGSFCSFAAGGDAVGNHEMQYITTSPIIYSGHEYQDFEYDYDCNRGTSWYIEGIEPHANIMRRKRSRIGSDVWLGQNVLITNGADIGNGVIAGAGTVITKDVPDYAIAVGVPARVIRYRYLPDQIAALNRIKWWNWTDDEIRERFDDLYLPISEFITKYDK